MTRVSKDEAVQAFRTLGRLVQEQYNLSKDELLAEIDIFVPATIFKNKLSPFSSLVSYLSKEGHDDKKIAKLLKRNKTFVKKSKVVADFDASGTKIPVEVFSDKLSVLEATSHYLKEKGKSNSEIASEIGKSNSSVWMLLKRAEEKIGGGNNE